MHIFLICCVDGTESLKKQVSTVFSTNLLFDRFTERNILRVFPAGTRIDSSNYNPVLAWNHGCQMVALNMQVSSFCLNEMVMQCCFENKVYKVL